MDDLLDLNWSSTPPNSSSPAAGPSRPAPTIQPKPSHLVSSFDLLSRPSPSLQPNYASSSTSSSYPSRTASPLPPALSARLAPNPAKTPSSSNSPAASPNPASSGLDAFSGLLSLSSGGGAESSKTLSLADRQKQLAEQKRRAEEEDRARFDHGDFWDKFGASGSTQQLKPTPLSQPKVEIPRPGSAALPALSVSRSGSANPGQAKSPLGTISNANVQSGSIDDDDDDFGLLALPSSSRPPANGSSSSQPIQSLDPFDFDQFSASVPSAPFREKSSGMRTPVSNFDFDEREGTDDEDDILGQLAQPAPKRISKVGMTLAKVFLLLTHSHQNGRSLPKNPQGLVAPHHLHRISLDRLSKWASPRPRPDRLSLPHLRVSMFKRPSSLSSRLGLVQHVLMTCPRTRTLSHASGKDEKRKRLSDAGDAELDPQEMLSNLGVEKSELVTSAHRLMLGSMIRTGSLLRLRSSVRTC